MSGAGVEAIMGTGYGLYAVTMRADPSAGAISSFYLYNQNGTYPSRWHEIDLEFTPGFTAVDHVVDPNHPHIVATGQCYQNQTNNLPTSKNCQLHYMNSSSTTGQQAGSALSFNTYNYRAIDGSPFQHSNDQVFMKSSDGNAIFTQFHTYYFYYTPNGVYWTNDLPATALTITPPATLPQPVFVKKDFNMVNSDPDWNKNPMALGFEYDAQPLTPTLDDHHTLAQTGALMNISMNLWDGSNTDPNHVQDWGGETPPTAGSSASYQYVAFYPLTTDINQAVKTTDPTTLQYGPATVYSDFVKAIFSVNGHQVNFNNLWQISNGSYLWPLGQLDPRNIRCQGNLTFAISNNYTSLRQPYNPLPCQWLNNN